MTKSPPYMLQLYKSALALLHSNPIFIPSLPLSSVCVKNQGGDDLTILQFLHLPLGVSLHASNKVHRVGPFDFLKGTYYENNTFPGIWDVVLPHTYKL